MTEVSLVPARRMELTQPRLWLKNQDPCYDDFTGPQPDLLQVKVPENKDAEDEEDNPLTKYFHSQL